MSQVGTDAAESITANQATVYGLDGADIITYNLAAGPNLYGGEGDDALKNQNDGIGDLFGGRGADSIHGGTATDRLYGEQGNDLLVGGEYDYLSAIGTGSIVPYNNELSSDDYLYGGDGTDSLYGFDGADSLYGGTGNDSNTATFAVADPQNLNTTMNVVGGLYGGGGIDYLDGGEGNDWLDGGTEADSLYGGGGDDQITGGAGADYFDGGQGVDYARYDNAGVGLVARFDGGAQAGDALGDTFSDMEGLNGSGNDDFLAGGYGDDIVNGQNGNDTLLGQQGNDGVYGGAGGDQLYGFDGNDTLRGGIDNDFLNGNAGNDYIYGDGGADTMYGEGGIDQFVYTSTADSLNGAADIIIDFQTGVDKINLAGVAGAPGGSFSTLAAGGGYTAVDIDIGANGSIDMRIIIGPGATVAAGDFIFD